MTKQRPAESQPTLEYSAADSVGFYALGLALRPCPLLTLEDWLPVRMSPSDRVAQLRAYPPGTGFPFRRLLPASRLQRPLLRLYRTLLLSPMAVGGNIFCSPQRPDPPKLLFNFRGGLFPECKAVTA
jgi:hypothetical protein